MGRPKHTIELIVKVRDRRTGMKVRVPPNIAYIVHDTRIGHAGGEQDKEQCEGKWRVVRTNKGESPATYWLECVTCEVYASEVPLCTCKTVYCRCGMGEDRSNGPQRRRFSIEYQQ